MSWTSGNYIHVGTARVSHWRESRILAGLGWWTSQGDPGTGGEVQMEARLIGRASGFFEHLTPFQFVHQVWCRKRSYFVSLQAGSTGMWTFAVVQATEPVRICTCLGQLVAKSNWTHQGQCRSGTPRRRITTTTVEAARQCADTTPRFILTLFCCRMRVWLSAHNILWNVVLKNLNAEHFFAAEFFNSGPDKETKIQRFTCKCLCRWCGLSRNVWDVRTTSVTLLRVWTGEQESTFSWPATIHRREFHHNYNSRAAAHSLFFL